MSGNKELRDDLDSLATAVGLLLLKFQEKHGPPPSIATTLAQKMGEEFPRIIEVHASVDFKGVG